MLVLYETPAGYALFELLEKSVLKNVPDMYKQFSTAEAASKAYALHCVEMDVLLWLLQRIAVCEFRVSPSFCTAPLCALWFPLTVASRCDTGSSSLLSTNSKTRLLPCLPRLA